MRKTKCVIMLLMLTFTCMSGMTQDLKKGDKAEALIQNIWKPVTIVNISNEGIQVKQIQGAKTPIITLNRNLVRKTAGNSVENPVTLKNVITQPNIHLGRYNLYSGIPSMYIGHVLILENGKYSVAFSSNEDDYDNHGTYVFHEDSQTFDWISGLFKNNNWGGKYSKQEGNVYRIEFNKGSFAESN